MDVYQMQLVKVGPSLRERAEQFVARQHHHAVVNRLRRFREELEAGMEPEPWTTIEAPAVTYLADICDALHLTANEKAEVLGVTLHAIMYQGFTPMMYQEFTAIMYHPFTPMMYQ